MDYEKMAQEIFKNVGTAENIDDGTHCFTRLRLTVKNTSKVHIDKLKEIEGVIDARFQNGQLQVIIGNDVGKVFDKMRPYLNQLSEGKVQKQSLIDTIFTTIAAIFTPILPAIMGAGLMKGILPIAVLMGVVSSGSDTYKIVTIIADTSFNFLPVLIAVSASRKFKVNEYLGVTLACSLLYPTILNGEGTLYLFNVLPIPTMSYTSTVIPIILGVWIMSYVSRFVDKIIPSVVRMIFAPLLVLAIMIPLTLIVFGPVGFYVGKILATISLWLATTVPFLYGLVIGGLYPFIIMTGMHYAFFPIMLENISRLGYENGFLPVSLFANIAMAAATFAVALKVKDKKMKEVSFSSAISAAFGITEPALYGVILKYKKALYAVMLASGMTSAIMITLGTKMYSFLTPGILSLAVFIHPDGSMTNFYLALIGVIACALVAFFVTLSVKLIADKPTVQEIKSSKEKIKKTSENVEQPVPFVFAPISGEVQALEQSSDNVFAEGLLGKGVLLVPDDDTIFAPFKGTVNALTPEKHAIGLTSDEGVELLIHIGIDTVELKGEGFEAFVAVGDEVVVGQKLIHYDRQLIVKKGYATEIPIVVTNTTNYFEVVPIMTKKHVFSGDALLTIIS